MAERIWGLLLTAMGALWIWDGWRLGREVRADSMFDDLGPDRYLMVLGSLLIVTGVALAIRAVAPAPPRELRMRFWPPSAPVTFTLCLAAYAALIPRIGYGVSTFLFFMAVFYFAGQRRWPVNLAMSAVAAISFYVLFVRLADMPLPKGIVGV